MKSCRTCKTWKDCNGKPWYSYGEIRWCVHQIIWIIENSDMLESGRWPLNPEISSYIDPQIKTGYASEAYYTKPIETISEVEKRLETTKDSGEALWDEVKDGLGFDQLSRPAMRALMYVKGFRQKRQTFSDWKKQVKQRAGEELPSPAP